MSILFAVRSLELNVHHPWLAGGCGGSGAELEPPDCCAHSDTNHEHDHHNTDDDAAAATSAAPRRRRRSGRSGRSGWWWWRRRRGHSWGGSCHITGRHSNNSVGCAEVGDGCVDSDDHGRRICGQRGGGTLSRCCQCIGDGGLEADCDSPPRCHARCHRAAGPHRLGATVPNANRNCVGSLVGGLDITRIV